MYVTGPARGVPEVPMFNNTLECVREIQQEATMEEKEAWQMYGRLDYTRCWIDLSEKQRWMLPNCYVNAIVTMAHSPAHISAKGIVAALDQVWFNKLITRVVESHVKRCMICATYNPGKGTPVPTGHFAPPDLPFEVLQMDFIEMERVDKLKYVLVMVCIFSRWVEAYPLRDNTALSTAKVLLKEYFKIWFAQSSLEQQWATLHWPSDGPGLEKACK